jgi:hypothetical protein
MHHTAVVFKCQDALMLDVNEEPRRPLFLTLLPVVGVDEKALSWNRLACS